MNFVIYSIHLCVVYVVYVAYYNVTVIILIIVK